MKKSNVIRAWRDEEYRESLSEAERAALPEHPAGLLEADDEVLKSVTGGCGCINPILETTIKCTCGTNCVIP